ncbi:unnamed protein product [Adineta steineri]|uniref:FAM20 C-terminal domain-containing protein n=1 Tax=Adineta steineri TaxID=433720 RepID=A0A814B4D4_9BILA|nr:unnamed protein product [Adineta steineri]
MRHIRLRLRTSILFILATLTIFFLITLNTLIWSTNELEQVEENRDIPIPPGVIPFWSAINHQNIYDIHATSVNTIFIRPSNISQRRVEELYELIRNAKNDDTQSVDKEKLFPIDSTWSFDKLVEQQQAHDNDDTNKQTPETHADTADSAAKTTKTTIRPDLTTSAKSVSEYDKIQLRNYVHQSLAKWKKEHQNDKIINLADLMHDELLRDEPSRLNTTWYEFMKTVNNLRVYDPNSSEFKRLLNHLQNGEVIEASEMSQGTQIKVIFDLPDGFEALFKPYRVPRNYQTLPDHFYFSDIERHHAEIAAFHLDKILGFYRVPPLIGRLVHITRDIHEKATEELAKTFFISPANNTCFRGHCSYYCDTSHAVCGKPGDRLEGSIQVLLPRPPEIEWKKITHPYRRSYSAIRKAKWESNENHCYDEVFLNDDYHNRLLLDMMDLSAFDFLIGNMDRHHMMRIQTFGANSALIHLDNGRSFGRYDHDELSILTPIRQCCLFRYSTFARLYRVYRQGLSTLLSRSLENGEQLRKILVDEHLTAIDRRLGILFAHLDTCIKTYTVKGVMIDDGID